MKTTARLLALLGAIALSAAPVLAQQSSPSSTETASEAMDSQPAGRIATMSSTDEQYAALETLAGHTIDVSQYSADPDALEIHDLTDMFGTERADNLRQVAEDAGSLEALQQTVAADAVHRQALDAAGYATEDILAAQLGDDGTLDIYVY